MDSHLLGLIWFSVSLVALLYTVLRRAIRSVRSHRAIPAILCVVAVSHCACGPDAVRNFGQSKPSTAMDISYSRLFGFRARLYNDKDVNVVLKNVGYDPEKKTFNIGEATVVDTASSVMGANVAQMQQVLAGYPLYTALQAQYGANAIGIGNMMWGGVQGTITASVPLLGPYLNARGSARVLDSMRSSLVAQVIGGLAGGGVTKDHLAELKVIAPDVFQAVMEQLKSMAGQAQQPPSAETPPPGAKPTAAREWWPNDRLRAKTASTDGYLERLDRDAARAEFVRDEREIAGLDTEQVLYRIR